MGQPDGFILEGIIQVSRLIIYDTSNFMDFPIGGQLTSIGNFLRFLCEEHPERVGKILLVGVTLHPEEIAEAVWKAGEFPAGGGSGERFGKYHEVSAAAVSERAAEMPEAAAYYKEGLQLYSYAGGIWGGETVLYA